MQIRDGIVEAIGHTPLIKLERASAATGCIILGKAEFMNPGGSVKDRPGRQMILEAEKRGELRPGGLVVESTAGNTGIGLALVANARGYRTLIVIPQTQSEEKKDMLRLAGAELVQVPALPFSNPDNYQHVGRRLAEQLKRTEKNGVIFADQWNNLDNSKAHYVTTGPEIWQQTEGKIDGFICAIGTGGTLAGVSRYLREQKKDVVIGLADPRGAAMYNLFAHGEAKASDGCIDHRRHRAWPGDADHQGFESRQALSHSRRRSRAASSSICWCTKGSVSAARPASMSRAPFASPRNSAPATPSSPCCADSGSRYQSKLFNPAFLRSKNLPVPEWLERKSDVSIPFEKK